MMDGMQNIDIDQPKIWRSLKHWSTQTFVMLREYIIHSTYQYILSL